MAEFKLEHDRSNCIACAACWIVSPKFWKEGPDGKSDIVGSKMREDGWEELEFEEGDKQTNMEAAESCPVNVIHVTNIKENKKLI